MQHALDVAPVLLGQMPAETSGDGVKAAPPLLNPKEG